MVIPEGGRCQNCRLAAEELPCASCPTCLWRWLHLGDVWGRCEPLKARHLLLYHRNYFKSFLSEGAALFSNYIMNHENNALKLFQTSVSDQRNRD